MKEELGIVPSDLQFLYRYLFRNQRESELVTTFTCICDGAVHFNREEIDEVRFWPLSSIKRQIGKGIFSNHFEQEFSQYVRQIEKQ
jgi:hypothetical protein